MYIYSIKFRSYIADVARRILEACPNFAPKTDDMGLSALHYACSGDNLEITKMLLGLDPGLAVKFDNNGYTPLHLAAMNAKDAILEEFLAMVPTSFQLLTREGETVFHLTVRFNRFNAFVWLAQNFGDTDLFHQPDKSGNTILHLAASAGRHRVKIFHIAKHMHIYTNVLLQTDQRQVISMTISDFCVIKSQELQII